MAAFVSRYANAFADVVADAKLDVAVVEKQLQDFLTTWNESTDLRVFCVNPAIAADEKVAFLDTLNQKFGLIKQLRNLIAVLITHNRIGQVVEVAAAYRKIQQQRQGISQAEIVTARALNEEERATLEVGAAKLAGGKVEASFRLDPTVLGGAVVRIGSTVYDGSVKGRLERLKEALIAG
jgi:F-type H+-transporting ATPase subunit delta